MLKMGSEITKRNRAMLDALYAELGDTTPPESYDARKDNRYRNLFSIKAEKGSVLEKLQQNILRANFPSEDMPSEEELFEFAKITDKFLPEILEKKHREEERLLKKRLKKERKDKTKIVSESGCKDSDTSDEIVFEDSDCDEDEDSILDHCPTTKQLLTLKANNYEKFHKKIQKILNGLSESFKNYVRGKSDKFIEDEVVEYIRHIETDNYFMSKPPRMISAKDDSGNYIMIENPEYKKWRKKQNKSKDIHAKERKEYIKKYGSKEFDKKQAQKKKVMEEYRKNRKYDDPSMLFREYGGGDDPKKKKEIPKALKKDFKKKLAKKEKKLGRSLSYSELRKFRSSYLEKFSDKEDRKLDSMIKESKKKKNQGFVDPWLDETVSNLTERKDGLKRLIKDVDKGRDKLIDMIEASTRSHGITNHKFVKAVEDRADRLQQSLRKKLKELKKEERENSEELKFC